MESPADPKSPKWNQVQYRGSPRGWAWPTCSWRIVSNPWLHYLSTLNRRTLDFILPLLTSFHHILSSCYSECGPRMAWSLLGTQKLRSTWTHGIWMWILNILRWFMCTLNFEKHWGKQLPCPKKPIGNVLRGILSYFPWLLHNSELVMGKH